MGHVAPGQRDGRIVLVEDDRDLALLLRYNFEARGYSVRWIANGSSALGEMRVDAPDAAVLDWGLPGLAGIEVLRRMRECHVLSPVPVLMLTARCLSEDRRRALETGANAFLAKPFSIHEVIDVVQRLAGAPSMRRRVELPGVS